jgi:hypothetical protein
MPSECSLSFDGGTPLTGPYTLAPSGHSGGALFYFASRRASVRKFFHRWRDNSELLEYRAKIRGNFSSQFGVKVSIVDFHPFTMLTEPTLEPVAQDVFRFDYCIAGQGCFTQRIKSIIPRQFGKLPCHLMAISDLPRQYF